MKAKKESGEDMQAKFKLEGRKSNGYSWKDTIPKKEANKIVSTRVLKEEDINNYNNMVDMFIRDSVKKNWTETKYSYNDDLFLGNTGMTLEDFKQFLRTEVCVALYKYDPNYKTESGQSVKESTFVYRHLWNRLGSLLNKVTSEQKGYGVFMNPIEDVDNPKRGNNE